MRSANIAAPAGPRAFNGLKIHSCYLDQVTFHPAQKVKNKLVFWYQDAYKINLL